MTAIRQYSQYTLIGLIALFVIAFGVIQIPSVKTHIIQTISKHYLNQQTVSIQLTGIRGVFPFTLKAKHIHVVNQNQETLATLSNLHMTLSLRSLLRGIPKIKQFSIDHLHLKHTLIAAKETSPPLQTIATLLPIMLNQSLLARAEIKHIQIESPKTNHPVQLTFHYRKEGIESHLKLTSIAAPLGQNQHAQTISGQFTLMPKGSGAFATLRITDKNGILTSIPMEVIGNIIIDDLVAFLPTGDLHLLMGEQNIALFMKTTHDKKTNLSLVRTQRNGDKTEFNTILDLKTLIESQRCALSDMSVKINTPTIQGLTIQGEADVSFSPQSLTFAYRNVRHDSFTTTHGLIDFQLATNLMHIKGDVDVKGTTVSYEGTLNAVGIDTHLTHALIRMDIPYLQKKNKTTFEIKSPHGIRPSKESNFTVQCHDFPTLTVVPGSILLGHSLSDITIKLSPNTPSIKGDIFIKNHHDAMRLTGVLTVMIEAFTSDMIKGQAVFAIDTDAFLTGKITGKMTTATRAQIALNQTEITLNLTKGEGSFILQTGTEKEKHLHPYGIITGRLSVPTKRLTLETLLLDYHQQLLKLTHPVAFDFTTHHLSNVHITIGKNGYVHYQVGQRTIDIHDVPLSTIRLYDEAFELNGSINGHLAITNSDQDIKGKFFIHQLAVHPNSPLAKNTLLKNLSWTLLFDKKNNHLFIDTFTSHKDTILFKAKGSISLDKERFVENTIDGTLNGDFDISLIASIISSGDRISGILKPDLRLKGALQNIQMTGALHVHNGLYESGDNGTYITDISGRLKAHGKRLIIEQITANDGRAKQAGTPQNTQSGHLDITGHFEIGGAGFIQSDIMLKLADLVVTRRDDMIIRATGDISMKGAGVKSKITGSVILSPSVILLEELTSDKDDPPLAIKELTEKYAKKRHEKSKNHLFPIELTLIADKNFYIRGFGLESEWSGQMTVQGDLSDPYLIGTLNLVKGKLSFFGKQLTIGQAKIWYDEEDRNNPNISLVGIRKVDNTTLRLHIDGKASSTKFSYTSTPAMPEDKILSRLLFGKEINKISAGQSVQLAAAAASLNGRSGLNLLEGVRHSFGFDTFELKENDKLAALSDSGQTNAQALRVGKEFDNVKIFIDQNIGSAGSKATVSTAIADNLYVDIGVGQKSTGSEAGLSYVIRY